ncbi:MAG: hypothetical protein ACREPM_23340 [Gemmatimonadaceae bacterium]
MALLDKLRQELDRAGRQASRAFDEGRLRLELYRAKQSVDRFARRFGYAVFRAKQAGGELAPEEMAAHLNNLTAAEAEVTRLETLIADAAKERRDWLLDNRPPSSEGGTTAEPKTDAGEKSDTPPSDAT